MKKKKFLMSLMTAILTMSLSVCPVFADDFNEKEDSEGSGTVEVKMAIESSFKVKLPAQISLSYVSADNNYQGSGNFWVQGYIPSDKQVKVGFTTVAETSKTFNLTGASHSKTASASSSFSDSADNIWLNSVAAESATAGTYRLLKNVYDDNIKGTINVEAAVPPVPDSYSYDLTVSFALADIS